MIDTAYRVQLPLRIDWSELDYFGHVNNVSFFKYIQASRVNYWEKIGLTDLHKRDNIGPILASCKYDFRQPLFYPGQITVLSRVDFIKNTSFGIHHKILNDNGEIAAEAHDIIVMFDFNKHEKIKFPKELKARIEQLEGTEF